MARRAKRPARARVPQFPRERVGTVIAIGPRYGRRSTAHASIEHLAGSAADRMRQLPRRTDGSGRDHGEHRSRRHHRQRRQRGQRRHHRNRRDNRDRRLRGHRRRHRLRGHRRRRRLGGHRRRRRLRGDDGRRRHHRRVRNHRPRRLAVPAEPPQRLRCSHVWERKARHLHATGRNWILSAGAGDRGVRRQRLRNGQLRRHGVRLGETLLPGELPLEPHLVLGLHKRRARRRLRSAGPGERAEESSARRSSRRGRSMSAPTTAVSTPWTRVRLENWHARSTGIRPTSAPRPFRDSWRSGTGSAR